MITRDQVNAATRHIITAAGVAVTIFGLQAKGVTMESVTNAIQALGEVVNSVLQAIAAVGVLYGAIQAARAASPTSQAEAAKQAVVNPSLSVETKQEVVKSLLSGALAAAKQDEALAPAHGELSPAIPQLVTTEAKVALLDATAALPEVKADIKVTSPTLAARTESDQIKLSTAA